LVGFGRHEAAGAFKTRRGQKGEERADQKTTCVRTCEQPSVLPKQLQVLHRALAFWKSFFWCKRDRDDLFRQLGHRLPNGCAAREVHCWPPFILGSSAALA